jgi:hypothetical protein
MIQRMIRFFRGTAVTGILVHFLILAVNAQEQIRVKAGEDFSKSLNSFGVYRLPAFVPSRIHFRDGRLTQAHMNYNLALGELQFLSGAVDTLSVGNPEELAYVEVDTILFYYGEKKYLEVIAGKADETKLAQWEQFNFEFEQLGAFDKAQNGVDVKSYQNYSSPNGQHIYDLSANQNRIITRETRFYLIDRFGKIHPATRSGFLSAFPHCREIINNDARTQGVHYGRKEDLRALHALCKSSE